MLNIRSNVEQTGIVRAMSEIAVQASTVKSKLLEISKQAGALAAGLQNAAPGDKEVPNPSIQYLTSIAEVLVAMAEDCDDLSSSANAPSGLSGI